jgi:hypothetical protein
MIRYRSDRRSVDQELLIVSENETTLRKPKQKRTTLETKLGRGTRRRRGKGNAPKTAFKKGRAKTGGRQKGQQNRMTREIKEAIIEAAVILGRDGQGMDGLTGYMCRLAEMKNPALYVSMMRILIPMTLEVKNAGQTFESTDQIRQELRAAGLPERAIYRLEHNGKVLEGDILSDEPPVIKDRADRSLYYG